MSTRVALIACIALASAACEKTDHESIDKWQNTKKGPEKLKKAFADTGIDADLSAHAGVNMIKKARDSEVRTELDNMPPGRRGEVIAKMAPRLWELARIEGELQLPSPTQVQAKDALVLVRKYADPALKTQIDGYLVDWYASPAYEGRAQTGSQIGVVVMRMVGQPAAKKLMAVADGIIAAPGQETTKKKIGNELLQALAVTGDPSAVKYVLDVARMDRGDKTLPTRAMGALYTAYVDPGGVVEIQKPDALVPNLDELVAIARDDRLPGGASNSAVALIRSVGAPGCLPPLVSMLSHPHADPRFRYFAPDHALKCGGVPAIRPVLEAMPDVAYSQKELEGSIVLDIANMTPREAAQKELRDLLASKSRVARWVAVETLAYMKSAADAPRLAAVKGAERLDGYWGDAGGDKPEPTLAQRAKELSATLSQGASK